VFQFFKDLFTAGPCNACVAKNDHIESLKEELRLRENVINSQRDEIKELTNKQSEMLAHVTGMNRVQGITREQVTLPRTDSSIGRRIRDAEKHQSRPELVASRKAEYDKRIADILGQPEIQVMEDEIPETTTKEIG